MDTKYYQEFYDKHESYCKRRIPNDEFRRLYLEEIDLFKNVHLSKLFPSTAGTVVEIGCATGDLLSRLPIDVPNSQRFGIDISPKNIEFAKKSYPEVNFFAGSFEEFIEEDGKNLEIDVIILSDILEHVEEDVALLKSAAECAKYVLINLPLEKTWLTRNRNYGPQDVSGHLRAYDEGDAKKLVESAGLQVEMGYTINLMDVPYLRKRLKTTKSAFHKKCIKGVLGFLFKKKIYGSNYFARLKRT